MLICQPPESACILLYGAGANVEMVLHFSNEVTSRAGLIIDKTERSMAQMCRLNARWWPLSRGWWEIADSAEDIERVHDRARKSIA
jgi:hypothetical protein